MRIKFNGYYWTFLDIASAIAIFVLMIFIGIKVLTAAGISLASIAGTICGLGALGFMFLYQLPILGNSFKAQELIDKNKEKYTREEARIILEDRRRKDIEPETLKRFVLFFCISGGLALVGVFTNT